ncbi:MAG: MFS transporter [Acidobacteria bacterium]|nr:MFS transporter [Acidobacteriota bacterium]
MDLRPSLSPLTIIFLTVFVNLIGFGIIIPLLPFYAQTFGASPLVIGLLFAAFSLSQLVAAPALGDLSDRWGRRPVLILSLLGTVVSFVLMALARSLAVLFVARVIDGLSGGSITTARAYIADVTREEGRAKAYGVLAAGFALGFILGPAIGGALAHVSYTAPIWAAAAITLVATGLAWRFLPETVHRSRAGGVPPWRVLPEMLRRPNLRVLLIVDLFYWGSFAVYQTTFALFTERRFAFDAPQTGYVFALFGVLGVIVQVVMVGRVVRRFGEKGTFIIGLLSAAVGAAAAVMTHSVVTFLITLVPAALGVGLCNPSLIALVSRSAAPGEQGRVQGVAGALESLGRTVGPVWGNGTLQHFGEGAAYGSAAVAILVTAALVSAYHDSRPLTVDS